MSHMRNTVRIIFLVNATLLWALCATAAPPAWQRSPESSAARAALFDSKADWLTRAYINDAAVRELTQKNRQLAAQERTQRLPKPLTAGAYEEAYISDIDGTPQPFQVYLPSGGATNGAPLLVYLHGYTPWLDVIDWGPIPTSLTNLAEQVSACVVAPFGRSNTDFQGIGEQDVLHTIDLMQQRFGTSPDHVVFCGYSMGGMGSWTIASRFTQRFAGAIIVCGRADWYEWQLRRPADVPEWRRRLIDAAFAPAYLKRLQNFPVLTLHGTLDGAIPIREARHALSLARSAKVPIRHIEIPGGDHWIIDDALALPDVRTWLEQTLASAPSLSRPPPLPLRPGQTPSRLQNAFLAPFVFVVNPADSPGLHIEQWTRFSKSWPRVLHSARVSTNQLANVHVFAFGSPEACPVARKILTHAGVKVTKDAFLFPTVTIPRDHHGLWLSTVSPWNPDKTAAVQCGVPWGPGMSFNHIYDSLPDVVAYTAEVTDGLPRVIAAGYWDTNANTIIWSTTPERKRQMKVAAPPKSM